MSGFGSESDGRFRSSYGVAIIVKARSLDEENGRTSNAAKQPALLEREASGFERGRVGAIGGGGDIGVSPWRI